MLATRSIIFSLCVGLILTSLGYFLSRAGLTDWSLFFIGVSLSMLSLTTSFKHYRKRSINRTSIPLISSPGVIS